MFKVKFRPQVQSSWNWFSLKSFIQTLNNLYWYRSYALSYKRKKKHLALIKYTKVNNSFLRTLTYNGNRYLHTWSVRFVDHLKNSYSTILKRKDRMLDNKRVYPVLPNVVTNNPPLNTVNYNVRSTKKIYEGIISRTQN